MREHGCPGKAKAWQMGRDKGEAWPAASAFALVGCGNSHTFRLLHSVGISFCMAYSALFGYHICAHQRYHFASFFPPCCTYIQDDTTPGWLDDLMT